MYSSNTGNESDPKDYSEAVASVVGRNRAAVGQINYAQPRVRWALHRNSLLFVNCYRIHDTSTILRNFKKATTHWGNQSCDRAALLGRGCDPFAPIFAPIVRANCGAKPVR